MSTGQISEVIERIARYVEKAKATGGGASVEDRYWGLDLPLSERSSEPPYRLTSMEVSQATTDYPYHLPLELVELYQRGNGCLPARSPSTHNWSAPEDYFLFPVPALARLMTLRESANFYRDDIASSRSRRVDKRIFPIIVGLERRFWGVLGSARKSIHAPILFYRNDDPAYTEFAWPSLTALLLSWIEVQEQQLSSSDGKQIEQIVMRNGGVYNGQCVGIELLYYLSFDIY